MKIADFIVNIIANVVYDVGISKTEKVRFYFFKLKEKNGSPLFANIMMEVYCFHTSSKSF